MYDVVETVEQALRIIKTWPKIFIDAKNETRRKFNQCFYKTIWLHLDKTATSEPADHLVALHNAVATLEESNWQPGDDLLQVDQTEPVSETQEPELVGSGSHKSLLVPLFGHYANLDLATAIRCVADENR